MMPSTLGHETSIIITRDAEGRKLPTFQLIPPIERKESRTSDSGISMCQLCNGGCNGTSSSNNTSASTYMAPNQQAAFPVQCVPGCVACNYLDPEYYSRPGNTQPYYADMNNNTNNSAYSNRIMSSTSPSPTPSRSSHQAVTAYCYCSRCTGRRPQRTKMYSKFKTASNAARAVARFESSLTPKETEAMFDHRPRDPNHKTEHGCFRKSVPSMPLLLAFPCCLLNFFLPGLGTLIATFSLLFGCSTEYGPDHKVKSFSLGILISVIQFTTAIFVVGWVWSIFWGINFVKHSVSQDSDSAVTSSVKQAGNRCRSWRRGSTSSHAHMLARSASIGADRSPQHARGADL